MTQIWVPFVCYLEIGYLVCYLEIGGSYLVCYLEIGGSYLVCYLEIAGAIGAIWVCYLVIQIWVQFGCYLGAIWELSRCSRSWLFLTENTTVGETGASEGADAHSGDPAIAPDDAKRWLRLTG